MTNREISNMDDIIDVRDIIARIEELEDDIESRVDNSISTAEEDGELARLQSLMDDMKGYGEDEQWRGDWYPLTLIRDSHFRDYAEELADDIFPYPCKSNEAKLLEQWPYRCIDWEQAARELRLDYSSVEFDGVTYWYR